MQISGDFAPKPLAGGKKTAHKPFRRVMARDWELYLLALPAVVLVLVFCYLPMYGILIAFQNYLPAKGVFGSAFVGFKHFVAFFRDPFFSRIVGNTVLLGVYTLIFGFPAPILFALLLNELRNGAFKKIVQTISYMPYFISTVIVIGFVVEMFGLSSGVVNDALAALGLQRINFLDRPEWFRPLYIGSGIWQGVGYSSIIYLAAISGINPELYESALIDGAGRWRQAVHITLPSIAPAIQVLFIFAVGGILGNDFQKILLMYTPNTYETADVISTYVFRKGILGGQYSYSAAVGFCLSFISLGLIMLTNFVNKKLGADHLY